MKKSRCKCEYLLTPEQKKKRIKAEMKVKKNACLIIGNFFYTLKYYYNSKNCENKNHF